MFSKELEVARKAAEQAATIIREYSRNESFKVDLKAKNDLVTDADLASEQKILETIKSYFPEDQYLAEESSQYKALPEGRIWIIDPIDGTTNFAHGFPVYCISIGFWEGGEPKAALVLEVANGEEFTAVKGEGAFLNSKQITVSTTTDPASSLIGTGFPYTDLHLVDKYLNLFKTLMAKTHGVRRPGSAAWDLCNVACGRIEGFYEYGLSPWDVAAAALIIKEAGGVVTDWNGGGDWLFGKRIIAGNKALAGFLLNEIHAHFSQQDLKA